MKEELKDEDIRKAIKTLRSAKSHKGGVFFAYCEKCKIVHLGGSLTPKSCFPNLSEVLSKYKI